MTHVGRPPRDRSQDPRDRVTPDAFSVAPDLLGVPLASHRRRIGAMAVDLLLVAVVTAIGGTLIWLALAFLFVRFAMSRASPSSMPATAFRGTVGCMGVFILFVLMLTTWGRIQSLLPGGQPQTPSVQVADGIATPGLGEFLGGLHEVRSYRQADSPEQAAQMARALAVRLQGMGFDDDDVEEFLSDMAPAGAAWRARIPEWAATEFTEPGQAAREGEPEAEAPPATLPPAETLQAEPDEGAPAADTIQALESRLTAETQDRMRAERALVSASRTREPGIRAWLRRIAEDLGLGFGWGAVYFSAFLTWWKGRTPGKRLFGLRVVRLDGQPLTWWQAFERYGGYAAGFATGLIGFLQVFWDPNRQATHDRLASTVVVMEGRPRLPVGGAMRHEG